MTTIIYDHDLKIIACDSRTSTNNMIVTDEAQKWFDLKQWRIFCTGQTCDIHLLKSDNIDGISYLEFIKYHYDHGVWWGCVKDGVLKEEPLDKSYAIGSGQKPAMFGLICKFEPIKIIETVKQIDFKTGGAIHSFNVTKLI